MKKVITNYENYTILIDGTVTNEKTGRVLKAGKDSSGYYTVSLYNKDGAKTHRIHRLIAEYFIPNPNNYSEVDHINAIKQDNRVENLRWTTHKGNMNNPIWKERNKLIQHKKKVLQYDLAGNFIKEFESSGDAAIELGVKLRSHIAKAANGNRNTAYGFIWRYKE